MKKQGRLVKFKMRTINNRPHSVGSMLAAPTRICDSTGEDQGIDAGLTDQQEEGLIGHKILPVDV